MLEFESTVNGLDFLFDWCKMTGKLDKIQFRLHSTTTLVLIIPKSPKIFNKGDWKFFKKIFSQYNWIFVPDKKNRATNLNKFEQKRLSVPNFLLENPVWNF